MSIPAAISPRCRLKHKIHPLSFTVKYLGGTLHFLYRSDHYSHIGARSKMRRHNAYVPNPAFTLRRALQAATMRQLNYADQTVPGAAKKHSKLTTRRHAAEARVARNRKSCR